MPKKKPTKTAPTLSEIKLTEAEETAAAVDAAITKTAKEQAQIESDNVTAAMTLSKTMKERFGFNENADSFGKTLEMLGEMKTGILRSQLAAAAKDSGIEIDLESTVNVHLNRSANKRLNALATDAILELTELRVIEKRAEKRIAPV